MGNEALSPAAPSVPCPGEVPTRDEQMQLELAATPHTSMTEGETMEATDAPSAITAAVTGE